MVDTTLFTNTNGAIAVGTGDNYLLGEGVTHYKTAASDLINVTGTGNNDIFINGSVVNLGANEAIDVDAASSGVSITVGTTGSIHGSTDYRGIRSSGDFTVVTNNGLITGGEAILLNGENSTVHNSGSIQNTFATFAFPAYAVQINDIGATLMNTGHIGGPRGVSFTAGGDITNTGTIVATGAAISLTGSFDTALVNTGAITSSEGDAVFGSTGVQAITNSGEIFGSMDLGSGNDTIVNSGVITGLIEMKDNDDILRNSGTIAGDVDMGTGVNKVVNSGVINGDVLFGSGDDVYRASGAGQVSGSVEGGIGADTLIGGSFNDELYGGGGADFLRGYEGDDVLDGDTGSDVLRGGAGDDALYGGANDDELRGGNGNDELYGGNENDSVYGGSGDDSLYGGGNGDLLFGNRGEDFLEGDAGIDSLYGGIDNDELFGGSSSDNLFGGSGDDDLYGGSGNDTLDGGKGDDDLNGGSGSDTLDGGKGDDMLTGNGGSDVFVFGLSSGNDVVLDYADGSDLIDLSAFNFATANEAETYAVNVNGGVLFDFSDYGFDGTLFIEGITQAELQGSDYIL